MYKLFKQKQGKSCGLTAIENLFQTDIGDYKEATANNLYELSKLIRELFGQELELAAEFYHHEGVKELPYYLNSIEGFNYEVIYGIPHLIQIKGQQEYQNHIIVAIKTEYGWEIYDGLNDKIIQIDELGYLTDYYHEFFGVYTISNGENYLTWNIKKDESNDI